jgi:MFS family permease
VGAPVALATGYLADIYNRTLLFGAITVFASTACAMSYFAQTYTQFFFARILTGVGVGGAPAVVFSTLADFYRYTVHMS